MARTTIRAGGRPAHIFQIDISFTMQYRFVKSPNLKKRFSRWRRASHPSIGLQGCVANPMDRLLGFLTAPVRLKGPGDDRGRAANPDGVR